MLDFGGENPPHRGCMVLRVGGLWSSSLVPFPAFDVRVIGQWRRELLVQRFCQWNFAKGWGSAESKHPKYKNQNKDGILHCKLSIKSAGYHVKNPFDARCLALKKIQLTEIRIWSFGGRSLSQLLRPSKRELGSVKLWNRRILRKDGFFSIWPYIATLFFWDCLLISVFCSWCVASDEQKLKNLRIASVFFVQSGSQMSNCLRLNTGHLLVTSVGKTSWMNSFYITIYQPEFADFSQFPKWFSLSLLMSVEFPPSKEETFFWWVGLAWYSEIFGVKPFPPIQFIPIMAAAKLGNWWSLGIESQIGRCNNFGVKEPRDSPPIYSMQSFQTNKQKRPKNSREKITCKDFLCSPRSLRR